MRGGVIGVLRGCGVGFGDEGLKMIGGVVCGVFGWGMEIGGNFMKEV